MIFTINLSDLNLVASRSGVCVCVWGGLDFISAGRRCKRCAYQLTIKGATVFEAAEMPAAVDHLGKVGMKKTRKGVGVCYSPFPPMRESH